LGEHDWGVVAGYGTNGIASPIELKTKFLRVKVDRFLQVGDL